MKKYTIKLACALLILGASCTIKNDATPDDSGFFVKLFGGAKNEIANQIIVLPDGTFAGVGYTESFTTEGESDVFFFMIDKNGNVITRIGVGGKNGNDIQMTPDQNFVMIGEAVSPSGVQDAFIIKTDKTGNVIWKKTYRPSGDESGGKVHGLSIKNEPSGGLWIAGTVETSTTSSQLFLTKLDAMGNVVRERMYGFTNAANDIKGIVQINNGDVGIIGTANNVLPPNNAPNTVNPKDMRVLLTNELANLKWDYNFNRNPEDIGVDLQVTNDGFVLLGTTKTSAGTTDMLVYRLNSLGQVVVTAPIELENNQTAKSVAPTQDGGYIVLGDDEKGGNVGKSQTDLLVTKLDYTGKIEWSKNIGSSESDFGSVVRQDAEGNYIILATIGFVTTRMCGVVRLNSKGEFLK